MKTTRIITLLAIAALIVSCGSHRREYKCISPLPAGIEIEDLKDCIVPVSFKTEDFNWMGGNLSVTVYSRDLYDAVEVTQLHTGDTIMYDGTPLPIVKVEEVNGAIIINDGQVDEGGCTLVPNEGGTYVGRGLDDHPSYTAIGKTELPLAENFVIIDCGDFPTDPIDTIRTEQKLYMETLEGADVDFSCLDTQVTIEKGAIIEINRRWIP